MDPGGRDGCRAPIPWDGSADHGWPVSAGGQPWLPFPPDADLSNHADLRANPSSILHLYRRLLALRHEEPALRLGAFERLHVADGVLAYRRTLGDHDWVVVINFTDQPRTVKGAVPDQAVLFEGLTVVLASDGSGEQAPFSGTVGADQALVLRR